MKRDLAACTALATNCFIPCATSGSAGHKKARTVEDVRAGSSRLQMCQAGCLDSRGCQYFAFAPLPHDSPNLRCFFPFVELHFSKHFNSGKSSTSLKASKQQATPIELAKMGVVFV